MPVNEVSEVCERASDFLSGFSPFMQCLCRLVCVCVL